MRVFSFNKVIYDGYLSADLAFFIVKLKPKRIFSFLGLIPLLVKYLVKRISMTQLADAFYQILLSNLTVSDLNLFKVNNVHKIDLDGFGVENTDIIITAEPTFLIDLFINRNQYRCVCTEYDLREREIIGLLNLGKEKCSRLKKMKINRISSLFTFSFKNKALLKMADYVLVYRDHEVIDYEQYDMTIKDFLLFNASSKKWLTYLFIAGVTGVGCVIVADILSIFLPLIEAFVLGYFLWFCITYYLLTTFVSDEPFNVDCLLSYLVGIIPNLLSALFIVLLLGVLVGFNGGLVMLIAAILSFPFLVFTAKFYKFI